ncbi:MAG: hypothetical protein EA370_15160, partial [Wenzhouxiangella sp.]
MILFSVGCQRDDASRQGADSLIEVADPLVGYFVGDFDGMVERRQIRALVPYSRTFFFLDGRGSQRGLSHAFMEAFEDHVNNTLGRGHLRVQVVYVPVTRDRLIPWLL